MKKVTESERSSRSSPAAIIGTLLEEYRAMYGLATLRIGSLDRRASVAPAVLGTFLASFASVGADGQVMLLLGAPLALIWLVRSAVVHAQSFEDAIRRIDQIERAVNRLAGDDLLVFQSSHPSRGSAVGGRTGADAVVALVVMSLLVMGACVFLFWRQFGTNRFVVAGFASYVLFTGAYVLHGGLSYRRYRYHRQEQEVPNLRIPPVQRRRRVRRSLAKAPGSSAVQAAGTSASDSDG